MFDNCCAITFQSLSLVNKLAKRYNQLPKTLIRNGESLKKGLRTFFKAIDVINHTKLECYLVLVSCYGQSQGPGKNQYNQKGRHHHG